MVGNPGILAIDVGAGTQDTLIYQEGTPVENCVQLVLPARTVIVGKQIRDARKRSMDVFLHGNPMGGGACVTAIREHIASGLRVFATPLAAKTVFDDLRRVEEMGVHVVEEGPPGAEPVRMGDIDMEALRDALARFEVELPGTVAVGVQDHGEGIGISNRRLRFETWRAFVEEGGDISRLLYTQIPPHLTRMRAVQQYVPGAYLMDTGAAAIWGALCDPPVALRAEEGVTLLNIGNAHTLGVLVKGTRVWGLFEHHTRLVDPEKIENLLERLRRKALTNEEVFSDGGHGGFVHPDFLPSDPYAFVAVTGPNRHLAAGMDLYQAAPYGNMMLTGSFGLARAVTLART